MAVSKNKKEKKVFLTIGILIFILLVLGGIRIFTNDSVKISSRVDEIKKYQKEHSKYEVTGWLMVPGTDIDYPVLENVNAVTIEDSENMDYLWKNGVLDKLNRINYIMGHNIMNLSKNPKITDSKNVRFEQLMSFTYLDFAKKNEYVQFTINGEDYLFKIFSVSYPDQYDVTSYNRSEYDDSDVKEYVEESLKNSIYKYDIDVNEKDTIISLITCTRMFEYERDFRVDARLVRKGEATGRYKVSATDNYKVVEKKMKGGETTNG